MRIGIDAHILGKGKGGVETALLGIIRALCELDRENDYVLYVTSNHPFDTTILPANFQLRMLPVSNPWIHRPLIIPLLYRRDRLDLILLQRFRPFWGCARCVLHVHDVLYETHPQFFPPLKRLIFNALSRASVRRATQIVTVTENSKRDIQNIYKVPAERVTVISNGIEPDLFHPVRSGPATDPALARLGVARPYVLVLGMLERHKNTHIAIQAFDEFVKRYPDYSLVLVGQARSETRKGYAAELGSLISRLPSSSRIMSLGYVSDADRLSLLSSAAMLVFPGAAEGFGLPPLESMACGVPVVAARSATALEVYGDAAVLAEPLNWQETAETMHQLASDEALRIRMINLGLKRAASFRWDRVTARLMRVFATAAQ